MTIKEIARLANVSPATVSKIINNKDQSINPRTRDRVLRIVKEYNYTPYGTVKNLTQPKSFLLGVLLRNVSQCNRLLKGLLDTAQEHGYQLIFLDSHENVETELKHITTLCKNHVDGVLWEPVSQENSRNEQHFQAQEIPVCYINTDDSIPGYSIDFFRMGYALTQKLIDYRHIKIACLLREDSRRSRLVREGFEKCLYDNRVPYHKDMVITPADEDICSNIMRHHISGIVSSHFVDALNLSRHLEELHYYIPTDLSLVSLAEDSCEPFSASQISSITIPYRQFARHVCEALIARCEKKSQEHPAYLFSPDCLLDNEDTIDSPTVLRAKNLVVVGSIHIDITFNVNLLPQTGRTTSILNMSTIAGGKGVNQAVGAARLGREVSLIGYIGHDTDSTLIYDLLKKEQVSTRALQRDMNSQTGKAYIYIVENGESAISVLSGANNALSAADIVRQKHLFKNAGFCLISTEIPMEAAIEAARTARLCGAKNIVKPASIKSIPRELLQYTDIFIPNRKEAASLSPAGLSPEEQAEYFYRQGIDTVIITLGHEGGYLKNNEDAGFFPAADCVAVDSTGGADAFIAALASYLAEGYSLRRAIRIASYAAGICVTRQGVVPALADRSTLETYVKKFESDLI